MTLPEHAPPPRDLIPRGVLVGVGVLLAAVVAMVASQRLETAAAKSSAPSTAAVVTSRDLHFADAADGSVVVTDARDGHLVRSYEPATNAFVRGVLRALARERHSRAIGAEPPFRLTRYADGRLSLIDPSTGVAISLEVFGPTNSGAFAPLIEPGMDGATVGAPPEEAR